MLRIRIRSSIVLCIYIAVLGYLFFSKPDVLPQMSMTWFGLPADKIGHVLMFLPFPALTFNVTGSRKWSFTKQVIVICGIMACGTMIAMGTEYIQGFLDYRSSEPMDVVADICGIITGGIICIIYLRRSKE